MQFPKQSPIRDPDHLAFIRKLPCARCYSVPCDAAHIRVQGDGGMGMKPGDDKCLSLCRDCHRSQHDHGERSFYKDIDAAHKLAHGLYLLSGDAWSANLLIAKKRMEVFA